MDALGFFSVFFGVIYAQVYSSNQQGNLAKLYSLILSEPISMQKQLGVQTQILKCSLDRNVTSATYKLVLVTSCVHTKQQSYS